MHLEDLNNPESVKKAFDEFFEGEEAQQSYREMEQFLKDNRYSHYHRIGKYWIAIQPFIFTYAIMVIEDKSIAKFQEWPDIINRWCYHTYKDCLKALLEWGHTGYTDESKGWHRHPFSGRRRYIDEMTGELKEEHYW